MEIKRKRLLNASLWMLILSKVKCSCETKINELYEKILTCKLSIML